MFWLFNKSDKYVFYQIFPYFKKYKDSEAGTVNLFYDLSVDNKDNINDIIKSEPTIINYSIYIKDNYIQYVNNTCEKQNDIDTLTFITENEFIKETDELNNLKIPYFIWKYTLTENNKMPSMSIKNYDLCYQKAIFKIYKINENKLFVIEQINNITKKYILEKVLN
jgi:hypothetical protein